MAGLFDLPKRIPQRGLFGNIFMPVTDYRPPGDRGFVPTGVPRIREGGGGGPGTAETIASQRAAARTTPGEQRMLEYRQSVKTPAAVRDASGNVYTGWSHEDALASMPSAARAGEVEFGFLPPAGRFIGVWEAEDRGLAGVFPKGGE